MGPARSLMTICGCVFSLACADGESDGPRAVVRDSAGVRIVSFGLDAETLPVHRVLQGHDLEIGFTDGPAEYAFSRIVDLSVTAEGLIVVSDGNSRELRVFDAGGGHLRTIGQRGEGPGEFLGAPSISGIAGDTVFAYDVRSGRVSTFLLSGRFIGSTEIRSGTGNRVSSLYRRRDGGYLAVSRWVPAHRVIEIHDARLETDSIVVEALSDAGRVLDTVKIMADRTRLRIVQDRGGGRLGVVEGDPPHLPAAFLESNGTLEVLGRSDAFELELISAGVAKTLLRVLGVDHPASGHEIRAHQEARIREEVGDRPLDPRTRQLLLDHLPDRLPSFAAVSVSQTGEVWVARSDLDGSSGSTWLVFSAAGELRGVVQTPAGMRLLATGPDFVVGVVADELGVPFVRRYPLTAPATDDGQPDSVAAEPASAKVGGGVDPDGV